MHLILIAVATAVTLLSSAPEKKDATTLSNDDPFGYMDYTNPGAYARHVAKQ